MSTSRLKLSSTEEALRKSKERYRALVEQSSEGIWCFALDEPVSTEWPVDRQVSHFYSHAYLTECNAVMARMYGFSAPEDFIGTRLAELLPSSDQQNIKYLRSFIRSGYRLVDAESHEIDVSGNDRYFLNNLIGHFEQGLLVQAWGTQRDITERKRAEEQLRRSREQLRALAARLQLVREEESIRIAREIHDELGQSLTALKIELAWLSKRLPKSQESLTGRADSMSKQIDATIQSVRKISTELRPGALDNLGLAAAIEGHAQEFQSRTGIKCSLNLISEDVPLDKDRSTAAFRIFQEVLTNIARHACATEVKISLREVAGDLALRVSDNGRGITHSEITNTKSLGLLGMRERALLLGGKVEIRGSNGRGTTVVTRFPLKRGSRAASGSARSAR